MIITSPIKFEVGKIYTEKELHMPFEMYEKIHATYRFMVLREATLEEFRRHLEMTYDNPDIIDNRSYFYEISMD
jgi:hypothetical protein